MLETYRKRFIGARRLIGALVSSTDKSAPISLLNLGSKGSVFLLKTPGPPQGKNERCGLRLLKRLENIVGSRPDLYLDLDLRKELVAARQYRGSVPRLVQLLAKSHAGGRTFEVGPLLGPRCPPSMRASRDCGHSRLPQLLHSSVLSTL